MSSLIVYGDFNCPYTRLASARMAVLEERGSASFDFRAVEHDPGIPERGEPVTGDIRDMFERELEQLTGLLRQGERNPLRLPSLRVNTRRATEAYASVDPAGRAGVREQIFRSYWEDDRDISDPAVLEALGVRGQASAPAWVWQEEWDGLPTMVPLMILPDGHVSKGLGVLERLGDQVESA
ncbi:MAG: DsbA family protein [Acidimicrobiia bacterium]|nr:DsbA family protein [Acidimicrobiia bacterium]